MFTFHHGHLQGGRCCEHGRVRSSIIMMRGHSTTRDYTCATSSSLLYISKSRRQNIVIHHHACSATREERFIGVAVMHIDNIESIDRRLINGTSSFTHCRRSSSYQQQVIVDREQQGIRASSSTRARVVVRCARCLFVLAYMSSYVSGCV